MVPRGESRRSRRRRKARTGAAGRGTWRFPPLAWALVLGGCLLWLGKLMRADIGETAFARVETNRSRLIVTGGWFDPLWEDLLAERLALIPHPRADDVDAAERIAAVLAGVPFVAEVGSPRVVWPDGLRVPVRLREPVACIRVGRHYMTVAQDGVVLPGAWSAPPDAGAGYLPVLGPIDASLDGIVPGEVLPEPQTLALPVATSLWAHLPPRDVRRLGRVVIDASRSRETSLAEAGTRLLLEGDRVVVFGRTPASEEPGGLPARSKWASVSMALEKLPEEGGADDWSLVDVRWDRPEIVLRESPPPEPDGG